MPADTSHHLAQTVFGSDKLNISQLYNIKGQVALGESTRQGSRRGLTFVYRRTVTGGGSGLGLVTAAALAQNGCRVYITGRRGDVLEQAAKDATPGPETGGQVIAIQADVSDKPGIDSECCCIHLLSCQVVSLFDLNRAEGRDLEARKVLERFDQQ